MWALSLWLETDRLCLKSSQVSSWVVQTDGHLFSIDPCQPLSRLYEPTVPADKKQILQSAILRIESLAGTVQNLNLGPTVSPFSVYINFDEPFQLQVRQKQLQVGGEWLRGRGVVEKLYFYMYLSHLIESGDAFTKEVLSDFLAAVAMNAYTFDDHLLEPIYDQDPFFWETFILSFEDYCLSSLKSPLHFEYCELQNELESSPESAAQDITIWGLRPYVSHALWTAYSRMGLQEKSRFIQTAIEKFARSETSVPIEAAQLSDLKIWTEEVLKSWGVKEADPFSKSLDLILDVAAMSDLNMYQFYEALQKEWPESKTKPSILFIRADGAVHFPTLRWVQVSKEELAVNQVAYFICGSGQSINPLSMPFADVFVIPDCENQEMLAKRILGLQKRDYASQSRHRSQKGRIMIRSEVKKPSL